MRAQDHATKLEHVVHTQDHTLKVLNHTVDGLNLTMGRVNRMQVVDEALLNVTRKTTQHLELGQEHQRKTMSTLERMQDFDKHSFGAVNSTVHSLQHTLDDMSAMLHKHDGEIEETKKEQEDTEKEREEMKSEQKAVKVMSISTAVAVVLYIAQQLAPKIAMFIATRFADRAKQAAMSAYRGGCEFTITIRNSVDGAALFGPEAVVGNTQLGEILGRMPPPPEGCRWELVSANVVLEPESRMCDLGEGDAFVLSATSVEDLAAAPPAEPLARVPAADVAPQVELRVPEAGDAAESS